MTMLLLGTAGWCLVSVLVAAFWAAVCAGARIGAQRQRDVWARTADPRPVPVPVAVPAPRAAITVREHVRA